MGIFVSLTRTEKRIWRLYCNKLYCKLVISVALTHAALCTYTVQYSDRRVRRSFGYNGYICKSKSRRMKAVTVYVHTHMLM